MLGLAHLWLCYVYVGTLQWRQLNSITSGMTEQRRNTNRKAYPPKLNLGLMVTISQNKMMSSSFLTATLKTVVVPKQMCTACMQWKNKIMSNQHSNICLVKNTSYQSLLLKLVYKKQGKWTWAHLWKVFCFACSHAILSLLMILTTWIGMFFTLKTKHMYK